ncbi:MAG: ABC transporter ATP-binding protein [Gemmatimonadetes bacterium]|nr:ABC transporter ATP-binding protein [Gemmatimonadota bacterium]
MTGLVATGLEYRYPDGRVAVDRVDLEVGPGARIGLTGRNGSGKSTLLLLLAGLVRPAAGTLSLDGAGPAVGGAERSGWRGRVGLVFQDSDDQLLAPTVRDDVEYGPRNLGLPADVVAERVDRVLALLEIADLAPRPIHALSLGQRRRVAIAGVLAMEPKVLLLDEPTAGLDPLGTAALLECLDRLHRAGTAIVLATLDLELALRWSDRLIVLDEGRVVEAGPPDVVLSSAHCARLMGRGPAILAVGRQLRAAGVLPSGENLPRDLDQLLFWLPEPPKREPRVLTLR